MHAFSPPHDARVAVEGLVIVGYCGSGGGYRGAAQNPVVRE